MPAAPQRPPSPGLDSAADSGRCVTAARAGPVCRRTRARPCAPRGAGSGTPPTKLAAPSSLSVRASGGCGRGRGPRRPQRESGNGGRSAAGGCCTTWSGSVVDLPHAPDCPGQVEVLVGPLTAWSGVGGECLRPGRKAHPRLVGLVAAAAVARAGWAGSGVGVRRGRAVTRHALSIAVAGCFPVSGRRIPHAQGRNPRHGRMATSSRPAPLTRQPGRDRVRDLLAPSVDRAG